MTQGDKPSFLCTVSVHCADACIGGSGGGGMGAATPFQISKINDSNKTKQKIEDNPLEKEEERKS